MKKDYLNKTDEELMKLYVSGDAMAFEFLYNRHKDRVYTYLNRRLQDKQAVEDCFQSVFIKFHKSREKYSAEYPILAWLYTISRSEMLDLIKKRKLDTIEYNDDVSHENDSYSFNQTEIDLEQEKSLNEKEKQAIQLRYLSDNDFDEIAKALKTSESNSRKLVSRGLQKLRLKYTGGK